MRSFEVLKVKRSNYEKWHNDLRGLVRNMTALAKDVTVSSRFDDTICMIAPELLHSEFSFISLYSCS